MKVATILKIVIGLILIQPISSFAQESKQRGHKKEIRELRKQFIEEGLQLSAEQAATFYPIYDKFQKQRDELTHQNRSHRKNVESLTEDQAKDILKNYLEIRSQEMQLQLNYYNEIGEILTAKQILILNKREHLFHKKVFDKVRQKRKSGN